ncbi:ribosome-associated translation inhibitor RaiA [Flavobacteriaceae bacterium R38]|nr:ribosome-associated translation inhibitor RaiA [Flavobacteriaceae bacterium R38]
MKIDIQFVHTTASLELQQFVLKRVEKLSEKYHDIIKADVFLKEENDPSLKGNICDIRLSIPGPFIFASSNEESFEAAIVETINDLKKQLDKRKGKQKTTR